MKMTEQDSSRHGKIMMFSRTNNTTGSASQTLKMTKSPATLVYQAISKCLKCDLLWSTDDDTANKIISMANDKIVSQMMPFSCNVFDLIPRKYKVIKDASGKEIAAVDNDSYIYRSGDEIFLDEFKDSWFKQVHDLTLKNEFSEIYVSHEFYEKLHKSGVLNLFMRCKTVGDLRKLLLILAGDVETNPGPDYKEICQDKHKKNRLSRQKRQQQFSQKDLRNLRKQTNDDFSYLKQMEKRECDLQIGSALASAFTLASSSYLGYKTNKTMNSLNNAAQTLTTEISKTLQDFRDMFSDVRQYVMRGINLIDLVGDIMMSLLQISFAKPGYKLASLGVELFRLLPKYGICSSVIDSVRTYIYPSMEKKEVELQIDTNDLLQFAGEITPGQVVTFVITILSVVFMQAIPKTSHMEQVLKRVGDVCRSAKNISDFNNTMHVSMTTALDYFKREVLGLRTGPEIEQFISGLDHWFDDVQAMLKREDEWKKSDQILRDPHVIIEVENLYKRGMEFSREISDKKMQRELTLPFQTHMRMLSDLMKMVDTSGAFGTRPRTQPVVIWVFGESGVGKSGMSWPLAVDLNNMFVPNEQEAKEFSKNIYMRNVEQEFWDNYQGQNVVIYDDFGQRVDSTGNPNEEFMELIRTANIAPYPLHMAHLEDKRKTRFTSKVLILTSNKYEQCVNSLTFPDAFKRRIDLCARITNKDEYTKAGYSAMTGKAVQRLDKKKVQLATGEIISTDVYEIELINPESGTSEETALSYEEFLERCVAKAEEAFDSSRRMNDYLERYAVKRFNEQRAEHRRSDKPVKKEVDLQINDTEYGFLDSKTDSEVERLFEQQRIVDEDDAIVKREDAEIEAYIEWTDNSSSEDLSQFDIYKRNYFNDHYRYIIDAESERLTKARSMAKKGLEKWKQEALEYIRNHPYIVVGGIIGAISTIFLVAKFWTRIVGKPTEVKKVEEADLMGVKVRLHNDEKAIDLSNCNQSQLMQVLPAILSEVAIDAGISLIMRRPYTLAMALLSGVKAGARVYVRNKIFDWHGQRYELIPEDVKASFERTHKVLNILNLEAQTSGDAITTKPQTKILEAAVSADDKTLKAKTISIEANASGDCRTYAKPTPRIEGSIDVDLQMWKDQVAQNVITNNIFGNLYKICKVQKDDLLPLLHGLFVRANVMLVPGHLKGFLDDDDIIEIVNSFEVRFRLPWKSIKKVTIEDSVGDSKEAMLLIMPAYVSSHKDITKHFSDGESMARYKRADVCLPTLRYSQTHKKLLMYILGTMTASALDVPIMMTDSKKNYSTVLRKGLEYRSTTTSGDCGAPLIINETQVLRKISGIHVAGDASGMCYAESITQKDLERAFKQINVSLQIKLDFDSFVEAPTTQPLPMEQEFDPVPLVNCTLPGPGFLPVGKVSKVPFETGKTELRPSLVYGKIDKILTKPANLKNVFRGGEMINLKHLNLKKCATDTPYIDSDLLDRAYVQVKTLWLKNRRPELARVLTYEESIVGSPDSEYLGPINRSSSPGFPWTFAREKGKKGKTGWFGDSEYILNEEVKSAVDYRINQARLGIRVPTVWVDTLKDERRPIAKVDALKTRVFSNGPMDYSIAFRQYFLGFIAHLMENRINNEVSIGTNVYSLDWKKTAMKLRQKGPKVIAGDFSTFDGTLNSCIMARFVDLANDFYNDGPENALIRQVLFMEVYNSVHLCDGSVYMMTHSQPSGNPATTPLNCFINSMGLRMVFEECARMFNQKYSMKHFGEHVSIVSYGDDNVVNFSDEVAPWFNMDTITAAFAKFGFIYTDETKSEAGTAPLWRDLSQVAYLKRNFRFDEERKVWEAPLAMDTILEMPNWCRGGLDILEGTKVNCENAIMELSMHERPVFEKWTRIISDAFYESTGEQLNVDTYKGYAADRYMQYYI